MTAWPNACALPNVCQISCLVHMPLIGRLREGVENTTHPDSLSIRPVFFNPDQYDLPRPGPHRRCRDKSERTELPLCQLCWIHRLCCCCCCCWRRVSRWKHSNHTGALHTFLSLHILASGFLNLLHQEHIFGGTLILKLVLLLLSSECLERPSAKWLPKLCSLMYHWIVWHL